MVMTRIQCVLVSLLKWIRDKRTRERFINNDLISQIIHDEKDTEKVEIHGKTIAYC